MRINYNALAMNATTNFGKINNKVAKSMSRLSSGYKITRCGRTCDFKEDECTDPGT